MIQIASACTSRFELIERKDNEADYIYRFQTDTVTGQECFLVKGEEMIECFCNGSFAEVSLFGKQRFCVGPFLRQDENEIRLKCTGSAANIFGNAKIPFGL